MEIIFVFSSCGRGSVVTCLSRVGGGKGRTTRHHLLMFQPAPQDGGRKILQPLLVLLGTARLM